MFTIMFVKIIDKHFSNRVTCVYMLHRIYKTIKGWLKEQLLLVLYV